MTTVDGNEGDDDDDDILGYWAKQQHRFPNIHLLARKILAIPASNTEIERLFSYSKMAVTDYRTRLGANKLNQLTFPRKNLHALKQLDEKVVAERSRKRKSIGEHDSENEHEQRTPSSIQKKCRIKDDDLILSDEEPGDE